MFVCIKHFVSKNVSQKIVTKFVSTQNLLQKLFQILFRDKICFNKLCFEAICCMVTKFVSQNVIRVTKCVSTEFVSTKFDSCNKICVILQNLVQILFQQNLLRNLLLWARRRLLAIRHPTQEELAC